MIGGVDHSGGGDWGCELRVPGGGVGSCWVRGKIRMMFNFFFFFVCTIYHVGS